MVRYLFWVPDIYGGYEDQPRFWAVDTFDSVKDLECAFVVDFLGSLFTPFSCSTCGEIDDIGSFERGCKVIYGRIFEREKERCCRCGLDVIYVRWVADDAGDGVRIAEQFREAKCDLCSERAATMETLISHSGFFPRFFFLFLKTK